MRPITVLLCRLPTNLLRRTRPQLKPEAGMVNFQLLNILGRGAFKVTAGEINWSQKSSVARRISAADFSTSQFNHPSAFKKSITPEGQLLAVLIDESLSGDFIKAFFGGRYSIRFKRADLNHDRTYYIEKTPGVDVLQSFAACLQAMGVQ